MSTLLEVEDGAQVPDVFRLCQALGHANLSTMAFTCSCHALTVVTDGKGGGKNLKYGR